MSDTVRLTVVAGEGQAELVCGLLRAEGIRCYHRSTDVSAEAALASLGQWREIVVLSDDLSRARELLDAAEPAADECVRCGRAIGDDGGWYDGGSGELEPYCGVCAERVFGPV
jgi:hypothetical protein